MVMAHVYTQSGEYDNACAMLDTVLSVPAPVTIEAVQIDPLFEPLWDQDCFHELLETYNINIRSYNH